MTNTMSPKEIVLAAARLFEEMRGIEATDLYFSPDYIEHNPTIPGGGLPGFVQLLEDEGFTTGSNDRKLEFHIHHVMEQGDYVFLHQHVTEPGKPSLYIMDLYRIADGKIAEHWDVMQLPPETPANTVHPMA